MGTARPLNWLLVLGLFMVVGRSRSGSRCSQRRAGCSTSGSASPSWPKSLLLQPLLWIVIFSSATPLHRRDDGVPRPGRRIDHRQAALITLAIFVGLTLTVFVTKKDFSFLRGT